MRTAASDKQLRSCDSTCITWREEHHSFGDLVRVPVATERNIIGDYSKRCWPVSEETGELTQSRRIDTIPAHCVHANAIP